MKGNQERRHHTPCGKVDNICAVWSRHHLKQSNLLWGINKIDKKFIKFFSAFQLLQTMLATYITLPTTKILSGKSARAWVSMDLYFRK